MPRIPNTAPGRPRTNMTLPASAKVSSEEMLDIRLTTFAFPEAVVESKRVSPVNRKIRNVPVPGPKNPS